MKSRCSLLALPMIPLFSAALLFWPASSHASPTQTQTAQGVVFVDLNENGKFDSSDQPLSDIKVSNGREIEKTDQGGRYELEVDEDDIIFVIKPRGYRTPLSADNLPLFYYIHKPAGSPEQKYSGVKPTGPLPTSIDFPLYKQREPKKFKAILFGDPQPRNLKEVNYISNDVVDELIGTDASFGVTLGDIVFDDLDVFQPLNRAIALIGIPWYNIIGNHDLNMDALNDHHSDETFESIYGPSYYSFDYGQVHFLVLDNIEWYVPEAGGRGKYRGGVGADQMQFIRNDLAMIPDDQMVVLMMHVPINNIGNQQELYRIIEKRPFCISVSGHTHTHEHRFLTKEDGWMGPEPHHHIVNVTVSGSWWSGAPDNRGIPHATMTDGAPNGHSILSFDGTTYQLDFVAAGRPLDYQMNVQAPDSVAVAEIVDTSVYVNVFNGSKQTQVKMQVGSDGPWIKLEYAPGIDPQFQRVFDSEKAILEKSPAWRPLSKPKRSSHLWKVALPQDLKPGTYLIKVLAIDRDGREFEEQRVIRVTP